MGWQVKVMPKAQKRLARMPRKEALRIVTALEAMQENPYSQDVKQLHGREEWRLRMEEQELVILALDVGPRGDVYK